MTSPRVNEVTVVRFLTVDDVMKMAESIEHRMDRGEDIRSAVAVVLFNFGDRFANVWCVNGEWTGTKSDVIQTGRGDLPMCPNGHVLMQGRGLKLVWV